MVKSCENCGRRKCYVNGDIDAGYCLQWKPQCWRFGIVLLALMLIFLIAVIVGAIGEEIARIEHEKIKMNPPPISYQFYPAINESIGYDMWWGSDGSIIIRGPGYECVWDMELDCRRLIDAVKWRMKRNR